MRIDSLSLAFSISEISRYGSADKNDWCGVNRIERTHNEVFAFSVKGRFASRDIYADRCGSLRRMAVVRVRCS